ncbi:MAG: 50S ribosomal protein L3 [Akkermansiaceae bacterium]|nr:50S ribosomal protein L3 [Akkermansiaceae bacterium]
MSLGLLGKKLGMTRIFDKEAGSSIPVTVINVAGNTLLQTKTLEKDGYSAVQVGFDDQKEFRVNKPDLARFKKAGSTPKRRVQEFRFENDAAVPTEHPGSALFEAGQYVDVIGNTIGRGFQGAVKRHGFHGQPQAHGHMMHRRTGAIGPGSTPGRVWKNQPMPGHMGTTKSTTQNLKVIAVREDDGVILVSGSVPGAKGAYLTISPANKK